MNQIIGKIGLTQMKLMILVCFIYSEIISSNILFIVIKNNQCFRNLSKEEGIPYLILGIYSFMNRLRLL